MGVTLISSTVSTISDILGVRHHGHGQSPLVGHELCIFKTSTPKPRQLRRMNNDVLAGGDEENAALEHLQSGGES
ncbi:hypothetical protein PF003_g33955 [Phytophthora fragariae]|nr:hypothetical protein PF003_g33955 [Phytophthora fragariae]